MMLETVFVTVGTTLFDMLIETVTREDVLDILAAQGCRRLILQIGKGKAEPACRQYKDIKIEYYRYKPSLQEDMQKANLVISHAGAGSVLESLGARKKLLVVVNELLMDNHQFELARHMEKLGHCFYCTCSSLADTLRKADWTNIQEYPAPNSELFAVILDKELGYIN
eukprot:Colp12_sorted_trinity150504_noHs@33165